MDDIVSTTDLRKQAIYRESLIQYAMWPAGCADETITRWDKLRCPFPMNRGRSIRLPREYGLPIGSLSEYLAWLLVRARNIAKEPSHSCDKL
jgi:hypothetical protein